MALISVERARVAAGLWAGAFAIAHVYWAFGGRLGVPASTEPMSQRTWFLIYDVSAGVLCLLAVVLLVAFARACKESVPPPALLVAVRVGCAVLALRALVGLAGDLFLMTRGELGAAMLFDIWFLAGALLFAAALGPFLLPRRLLRRA